jgi:hypothetical protein
MSTAVVAVVIVTGSGTVVTEIPFIRRWDVLRADRNHGVRDISAYTALPVLAATIVPYPPRAGLV